MSLASLFAAGANRTVESLLVRGVASISAITESLTVRFGVLSAEDLREIPGLIGRVQEAVAAGRMITGGVQPLDIEIPENPSLSARYSYTTIARTVSPLDPLADASIPWTITSDVPLSPEEIRQRAISELTQWQGQRETVGGAMNVDLIRRDVRTRQNIAEWGSEAADQITIEVLSAYRS